MVICCNYGCSNTPFNKKIRCGTCRRKGFFLCMDCGMDHTEPRAKRCKDCRDKNNALIHEASSERWRNSLKEEKNCVNCGVLMPSNRSKYCRTQCQVEATEKRLMERRKITNCKVCSKSLMGTRRHGYCSNECHGVARAAWLIKFNEKRRKATRLKDCEFCGTKLTGNQTRNCGKKECMTKYNSRYIKQKRQVLRACQTST